MYPKLAARFPVVCLRVIALLMAVLLFGGCSLSGETPSPVATSTAPAPTATVGASPTQAAVKTGTPVTEDPSATAILPTATAAAQPADGSSASPTSVLTDPPADTPAPVAPTATSTGAGQRTATPAR